MFSKLPSKLLLSTVALAACMGSWLTPAAPSNATDQDLGASRFPHIKTWGVLYRHKNVDDDEVKWWASHLDFTVFGPIYWANKLRPLSPSPAITYMNHHNITVETSSSSDWQSLVQYSGANLEDMFFHYAEDTTIKLNGVTCVIKGWGKGTATSREQARVPTYWVPKSSCGATQRDRWSLNIANPRLRGWVAQRASELASSPYNGIFFDNANGNWLTSGHQGVVSGGEIAEYPGATGTTLNTLWNADHKQVLAEAKSALGNRLSIINTSNYQSSYKWVDTVLTAADGSLREFWFDINSAWGASAPPALDDIIRSDKSGQINLIWVRDNHSACCNNHVTKTRNQIWGLSAYYLIHGRHTYFKWSNDTGEFKINDRSWFPAIEYNIGQPSGDYSLWPVTNTNIPWGIDLNGNPIVIYARDFSQALVLNRPKAKWNYNDFSNASAITVHLPTKLRPLNADGSLDEPTDTLTLRNGEGAILIKPSNDKTPPMAPTLLR